MNDIIIREAQPADYEALFALVQQTLSETGANKASIFSPELWRWQCLTSGFETLVVVAQDGARLVGSYHLVSRDMLHFGQPGKMVLLQDLGVLPDYRRHGLFVRMSEFATSQVPARGWDVTYSFPNHRSYPGFIKKQGYHHVATVPVYVRPLNPGSVLAERLPLPSLWRGIGRVGTVPYNALFRLRAGNSVPIMRFTSEVDALSRQFVQRAGIGGWRHARFLNWRFMDKPTQEYRAWGSYENGTLHAYLVTREAPMFGTTCLLLMDFGCVNGADDALRALIAARLLAAREEQVSLAVTMGLHPFLPSLSRLGFITVPNRLNPRPLHFIVRGHSGEISDDIYAAAPWFTSLADWDVL